MRIAGKNDRGKITIEETDKKKGKITIEETDKKKGKSDKEQRGMCGTTQKISRCPGKRMV